MNSKKLSAAQTKAINNMKAGNVDKFGFPVGATAETINVLQAAGLIIVQGRTETTAPSCSLV